MNFLFNLFKTWMLCGSLIFYFCATNPFFTYATNLTDKSINKEAIYPLLTNNTKRDYSKEDRTKLLQQRYSKLARFKAKFLNNSVVSPLALQSDMIVTPSVLVCNKPITITATIENTGTNTFIGDIIAELFDSQGGYVGGISGYEFSNGIASGSQVVLKFETTGIGFKEGRYQIALFSRVSGSTIYDLLDEYVYQNPKVVSANCTVNNNCQTPVGLKGTPTYTNISLSWTPVPGATGYQTRIRPIGSTNWIEGNIASGTGVIWYGIIPCSAYEFQVRAICGSSSGNYSSSIKVNSQGCNDSYCYSYGDYQANWIQKVQLNTIVNESGINLGYANFTNRSTILEKNRTYNMVLIPGTGGNSTTMYWRVWIDYNQDNDFDDPGEQVVQRSVGNLASVTATFTTNNAALPGLTRMRISMTSDGFAAPCETERPGEVEDYTVRIAGNGVTLTTNPAQLDFSEFNETKVVDVKSNTTWIASKNLDWLSLEAATGIGNGNFNVQVSENLTGEARNGVITVTGDNNNISRTISVTQRPAQVECDIPSGSAVVELGYAFAWIGWQEVVGATGYQIRFKKLNRTTWTESPEYATSGILLGSLEPCMDYEIQVRAVCGAGKSDYSSSLIFKTNGCGDNLYCYSYGLSWEDWIARVQLNTLDNTSDNNYGYSNFTNLSTTLRKGQPLNITLTPGKEAANKSVYWRAWIDYNQDGDFLDANEQIAQITGNNTSAITSNFLVPSTATNGRTRMRVSMSLDNFASSCETTNSREVEDYTIIIEGGSTATLNVNPERVEFTENGGKKQVAVTATIPWSVVKSAADTWIRRISPSNGINNGIVEVEVEPNQTFTTRTATLTVSGAGLSKTIAIVQSGKAITPSIVANPSQINFTEVGGNQTITVQSNIAWRVVGVPIWLSVSPSNATGNADIRISALPNETFVQRSATIEITGNNTSTFVNINQAPSVPISCNPPTGLEAASVGYAHIVLFWNEVQGATGYQTRYRVNNGNWQLGSIYDETFVTWGNRTPCTVYEYQVRTYCGDSQASEFSPSFFVTTEGCNDTYCYSYGLAWNDWIQRVQFNTLDNNSDFDFGYANYTNISATTLRKGQTYPLILTPGKDEESKLVYWSVWIDYNQNGDFSDLGENIFEQVGSNEGSVTGSITIGQSARDGITRMRVTMSLDGFSSPCATGNFREVEDYQVLLQSDNQLAVTPNSFNVDAGRHNKILEIITNNNWIVSTDSPWIKLGTTNGVGNQALGIVIESNPTINVRTGNILVNSNNNAITVPIRQDGAFPFLSIIPDSIVLTSSSSERVVIVTSNLDWAVTEAATWLKVEPATGSNNGNFVIKADENEGDARSTIIEVSGSNIKRTIVIVQERSASTGGTNWNVSPGGYNEPLSNAKCVTFEVTSIFSWQAQYSDNWITSITPNRGNRSSSVEVCFNENLSTISRRAAIVFSAVRGTPSTTVYIEQAGRPSGANLVKPSAALTENFILAVSPNPTADIVHAQVHLPVAQTVRFTITDMQGRVVHQRTENLVQGNQRVTFEGFNTGMYLLQGVMEDGTTTRSLFVVQQ